MTDLTHSSPKLNFYSFAMQAVVPCGIVVAFFLCHTTLVFAQDAAVEKVAISEKASTVKEKVIKKKKSAEKKEMPPVKPVPVAQQPYLIQVDLYCAARLFSTKQKRERFQKKIESEIERLYGAMWSPQIKVFPNYLDLPIDSKVPAIRKQVSNWYEKKKTQTPGIHKHFIVRVQSSGGIYKIAAQEWDTRSESWTPEESSQFLERDWLISEVGQLLERVFRPTCYVVIDRVEGDPTPNKVYLTLQAGEFPAPTEQTVQLKPGDILKPLQLYLGKSKGKGVLRDIRSRRALEWTYLVVEEVDRGRIRAKPHSTFRYAIAKPKARFAIFALRIRAWKKQTRLKLTQRTGEGIGSLIVRIGKYNSATGKFDILEDQSLDSDREGWVTIPAVPADDPVSWRRLYIVNGSALLARVPILPGEANAFVLPLPDGSVRLDVEGKLIRLRSSLIELIARRAVLFHRIRKLAEKKKWADVDKLIAEDLEALPDAKKLLLEVNAIRIPAIDAVTKQRNRGAKNHINSLCTQAEKLINKFVDDDKKRLFLKEIEELRQFKE